MQPDFTIKLLEWNAFHNNRQMPWKGERNPYRIWLSEVILQQTRVEQGWAYYERFIDHYPDVHALARVPEPQVYKLWEGLGYYSRCSNLIATARFISEHLQGEFPTSYNDIIKLKGIGPYTAAAISSFAFDEKRAVVDGNVQRVLARYFGISTPVDTPPGKKLFSEIAQSLIDEQSPSQYNQAIMDFGATICKPQNPVCDHCNQATECEAFNHGFVNGLPVKLKTLTIRSRWLYYFIIERGDEVFIRKRETKDIWQNLHEFVLLETEHEQPDKASAFLSDLLQHQTFSVTAQSDIISQQLTHQRIKGRFLHVQLDANGALDNCYTAVKKINIDRYAFPRFISSYLEKTF